MENSALVPAIIQIHPTKRCNLQCLHCYSSSGPGERDQLPYSVLEDVITDASEEGYRITSFSGGEPVLFDDLGRLLRHSKALGMRTTVTSNGMLLEGRRLEMLAGATDVLAISLDGIPEAHNRMRGSAEAFDRMAKNLDGVRKSGISFGFIFTLTLHNVDQADWAAQFAVEQGAKLFQIHPLEEVGRAALEMPGCRPDETESTFAFFEAERIRRLYGDKLFVQLDVVPREMMRLHPRRFQADATAPAAGRLADCIAPLVVEADGTVSPIGFGFSRAYAIGSLLKARLRDLAPRWIADGYPKFRALCERVHAEASRPTEPVFCNWYELIELRSAQPA